MKTDVITLIERDAAEELQAYFSALGNEKPLDTHEELVLLNHFLPAAVKSYINRFRFSEQAELLFIDKAPADIRLAYINFYGLREETQKYIISHNLREAARDFMQMRYFSDIDYLIDNGSSEIVRAYFSLNKLENEEHVRKLLHHDNDTLFYTYACKWVISENIKREIIEQHMERAFNTIMYKFYRKFRKKAHKTADFQKLMSSTLAAEALPAELQVLVLSSFNRFMIEILLKTCPLAPIAQETLWKYKYDSEWLKLHVEHLYGMAGYRFTPENEVRLFKELSSKNLDDCLTTFRHQDDVSFVQTATFPAVKKYIKSFWLSDEAQIALLNRGNSEIAKDLISRYSPQHGLCWQAEIELIRNYSEETIKAYISFHTLCWEAIELLKSRFPAVAEYYYSCHRY